LIIQQKKTVNRKNKNSSLFCIDIKRKKEKKEEHEYI